MDKTQSILNRMSKPDYYIYIRHLNTRLLLFAHHLMGGGSNYGWSGWSLRTWTLGGLCVIWVGARAEVKEGQSPPQG